MSLSDYGIRRPIATALLMTGALLVGLVAYSLLPVAPLPQVDFPTIAVEASLPGASPETVASSLATPLERSFASIPAVSSMTSTSSLGSTGITLQFDLSTNIDAAAQEVQAAISAAAGNLPHALISPPTYHKVNPADFTILSLALTSSTLPLIEVDRCADELLASQLSQLPGVGLVDFHGEQKPAIRVRVDPAALAQRGLTLEDVRAQLLVATVDDPKGEVDTGAGSIALEATDQLLAPEAFQDVVLAYQHGAPIRVRDIGQALAGPEDVREQAWLDGERTIIVDVHKQPGYNVIQTIRGIRDRLPELLAALPPRIRVRIVGDRTQTIEASLHEVQKSLALTVLLVVLVMWLFLRDARATSIPALTIPLSFVGTYVAMFLLHYSLDNISLMALTIAVGFVVDDAIVVIENIMRHVELGLAPVEAASIGAFEVSFTVVSMTLSLVAVFIPVLLMGGIIGRMFREFAITLSVAVLMSGAIALLCTPMLCAHLLRGRRPAEQGPHQEGAIARLLRRGMDGLTAFYAVCLDLVLAHRTISLAATAATAAITIWLYVLVPKGFIPQQDTGLIIGVAEAAPDIGSQEMGRRVQDLMRVAMADPAVDNVYAWIGANPTLSQGRVLINLKGFGQRTATAAQVVARLKPKLARVEGITLFMQLRQDVQVGGRPSKTQYQYTLEGADSAELSRWARRMLTALQGLHELRDVTADIQADASRVMLRIDRDTAARFGITAQLIDDTLYDAFGQRQVATVFTQLDQFHVVLEAGPGAPDPATLSKLYLRAPTTGQLVPLSLIASTDRTLAPITINHQNIFPAITLSFNIAPGYALGDAVASVAACERTLGVPTTVRGSFQGAAKAFQASIANEPWLILAAILAVYIVLGVLYESIVHPLTILSTLPSAGLGALLALIWTRTDLSVMGLIGILLLIGIVKKNAIMMVDVALGSCRAGMEPQAAIRAAALQRLRPILMTTAAALLGALPLALGSGAGAELRRPLGITIVGGLLVSQVLTLLSTPVVFLAMERVGRLGRSWRRQTDTGQALGTSSP